MARALEAALIGECLVAAVGRARHGRVLRSPRHRAAEVRAFPVQREETLGHTRQIELAVANLLHVADIEVADVAGYDVSAEGAQAPGSKEAQEADAPLAEQDQD